LAFFKGRQCAPTAAFKGRRWRPLKTANGGLLSLKTAKGGHLRPPPATTFKGGQRRSLKTAGLQRQPMPSLKPTAAAFKGHQCPQMLAFKGCRRRHLKAATGGL
jgi:hypothetical protein